MIRLFLWMRVPPIAAAIGFANISNHGIRPMIFGLQGRDQRILGVDRQNFRSPRESKTYDVISHCCCSLAAVSPSELSCPGFRSLPAPPAALPVEK